MNLDGWDTCSIVSTALVNEALARRAQKTIRTFTYTEDDLEISGAFGPWALVPGGTMKLVHVAMPIASGTIKGVGAASVDLSGLILVAQMRLGLIEAGAGKRNLSFDTTHGESGGQPPIVVTQIEDPSGRLGGFNLAMVKEALTQCLSDNAADASFVFASVDARSTATASGLACPANDWAFVDAGAGREYLALLGSLDAKRVDGPIRIDPGLISPDAPAYFAVSQRLFNARALKPIMEQSFRPRTSFAVKGNSVISTKPVGLGKRKVALITVKPILDRVTITPVKGALNVVALAHADLPFKTRLDVTVTIKLAFQHNPRTGAMSFKAGKPVVKHKVSKSGIVGHTLGLIVELIVALAKKPILRSLRQIANGMQAVANPASKPVVWTGVRDFHAALARWDDGLWIADTRPVVRAVPAQQEKINEPA
ncbi:MAG: TULIP family P47-like protein [Pseudomonadota bacterium]